MTDDQSKQAIRIEDTLLLIVGVVLVVYGVSNWVGIVTYRLPAVGNLALGLGFLVWAVARMWRSQRTSTDQSVAEKRDV